MSRADDEEGTEARVLPVKEDGEKAAAEAMIEKAMVKRMVD